MAAVSRLSAGFVAVLVGYTSSAAIIFQAADAAGATPEQIGSWLWALGIGMGLTSIGFSFYYRHPVLTAWSTPGAALLVTALSGVSLAEAIGVFLFSSALITLCGLTGWFDKLMGWIPQSLASAMLAGVLLAFGLKLFSALEQQAVLVSVMLASYLLGKIYWSRYVIPIALMAGCVLAAASGLVEFDSIRLDIAVPVLTRPEFSMAALVGVGIPLFIVTMASQNVPGMATLRANGYRTPASPLMTWTGITGLLMAPLGGFAYNLAAITAAICMGKDADPDPNKRYQASMWAGGFYLLTGIFGATVVGLFNAFPNELVMAIAGLALLATIGSSLSTALQGESKREAALITFLITASGVSLFGIGSAFWGLVIGGLAHGLLKNN
ncbi:benzoate/H(+) symporter BenE family transporter [Aestuariirhabdus haliotis]|uniref:benzoate/H(+) symporter BenE family transporter n=1 Tax=Aestuariirhabdus haliotis TaxID=2918751 RepID=UPI0020BDB49F|nr:benzoate/H(+) symporter BenE family transporter [Aestuariirhabdus haliotis]MCL6420131.1 benzoate/H(+) symporter BenE family transporter [Aestuariirhabdus haliotis]